MRNERHEAVADNVSANHQFREVAKMIPHEEVSVSEMQQSFQPVTDCHGLNAAAMSEACANIAEYAREATCYTENSHLLGYLYQIEEWAEAALSAPPRNCDVGTADEQLKRFKSFCKTHLSGTRSICSAKCPCVGCRSMLHCLTKWSQMQYEEVKE